MDTHPAAFPEPRCSECPPQPCVPPLPSASSVAWLAHWDFNAHLLVKSACDFFSCFPQSPFSWGHLAEPTSTRSVLPCAVSTASLWVSMVECHSSLLSSTCQSWDWKHVLSTRKPCTGKKADVKDTLETTCCTKLLHQFYIIFTSLRGLSCYHHILTLWQEQPNPRTTGKFTELLLFSLLWGSRFLQACFYYEGIGHRWEENVSIARTTWGTTILKKNHLCYIQQKMLHSWCFGTAYGHRVAAFIN